MYRNILVPISFDPDRDVTAPSKLAGLLATDNAEITFLHVIEQVPSYAISYMPAEFIAESRKAVEAEIEALAKNVRGAKGIVVSGHSARSILDYAEEHGNDLIIIASHRPGMQDLLLGSTASQVVRHASCAVHVIR